MGARAYICRYNREKGVWQVVYSHWGAGWILDTIKNKAKKYFENMNYRKQDPDLRREMDLADFKDYLIELVEYEVKEKGERIMEMSEKNLENSLILTTLLWNCGLYGKITIYGYLYQT